ncbi:3D domain-containing protein [Paenibacillus sp. 1001270B_150601_E10]|uniref:3D domain-containing protein n=1 Tax=Paenibacillus sp. 1001270B_150601_E10 TaxID=2787079 RepID=UPI00189DE6D0|nr:3D domain-containing protein [Paenibacillus sp. 1001270B_150601_E10]
MGNLVNNEPHDPRSSSKSLALKWKHENMRVVSVIAVVAIAITLVSVLVGFSYQKKTVSLFIDGQENTIETRKSTLRDVLDEHAIALGAHDKVSMMLDTELEDGVSVSIKRAKPVQVTVDGKTNTLYTTEDRVSNALEGFNVTVNPLDKVFPDNSTAISKDMEIKVVRITKDVETREVKVPFKTVKQANADMKKGTTKTVQQGQQGVVLQNIENTYQDGKLVHSELVEKKVQAKTVNKIVAYGTKKEPEVQVLSASTNNLATRNASGSSGSSSKSSSNVSKDGINFKYKQKLTNVQLTAYTEQPGSAGAKTASGTKVTEGRTIAVDPDVVPLGWWVYIEGYGFYRAEDTGGAVKGKIMDIYFDSSSQVKRFGRKKGNTVYVIGPVKPEAN